MNTTCAALFLLLALFVGAFGSSYVETLEKEEQAKVLAKKIDCIKEDMNQIKKEFDACKSTGFGDRSCAKVVSELYCKADASDVLQVFGIVTQEPEVEVFTNKIDCIKESTNGIKKEFNACKSTGFGDRYCAKIVSELYCKADTSDVLQVLGIETH